MNLFSKYRRKKETKTNLSEIDAIKPEVAKLIDTHYSNFVFNVKSLYPKIDFQIPDRDQLIYQFSIYNYKKDLSAREYVLNIFRQLLNRMVQDYLNQPTNFCVTADLNISIASDDFWDNERYNRKTLNGKTPKDWNTRRIIIHNRDKGRCQRCGMIAPISKCHIHHIRRRSDGGDHSFDNLATLCRDCHTIMDGHEKMRAFKTYYVSTSKIIHRNGCVYANNSRAISAHYPNLRNQGFTGCKKCKPWITHERSKAKWKPFLLKIPVEEIVFSRISIDIS